MILHQENIWVRLVSKMNDRQRIFFVCHFIIKNANNYILFYCSGDKNDCHK